MMVKVGILRGFNITPWEMQNIEKLSRFGIEPLIIGDLSTSTNTLPLIKLPGFNFSFSTMFLFGLRHIVEKNKLDIIDSLEVPTILSYQAIRTQIPTIITVWENIPLNYEKGKLEKFVYTFFGKDIVKKAEHFIAITQRAAECLKFGGIPETKISVIPYGVDTKKFKPSLRKLSVSTNKSKKILFVGRLVWEKGIKTLIVAFALLKRKYDNVTLIIVGKGPLEGWIHKLVMKLNISNSVKFFSEVDYSKIPNLYNSADIFCLPSIPTKTWEEQFGFALVEAMACGLPVIVSKETGAAELVINNKSGIILNKREDSHEIAEAIKKFIKNKRLYNKMRDNSLKTAKKYSWDNIIHKTIKLFEEVYHRKGLNK